ncbi:MAG: hypothetical protein ACLT98_00855 [Eggerthellaceae bacterium]
MYMSIQSDVEISQGCEPCEVQLSLRIGTPKLPSSRRWFRVHNCRLRFILAG